MKHFYGAVAPLHRFPDAKEGIKGMGEKREEAAQKAAEVHGGSSSMYWTYLLTEGLRKYLEEGGDPGNITPVRDPDGAFDTVGLPEEGGDKGYE